jgi:hypothetical protein
MLFAEQQRRVLDKHHMAFSHRGNRGCADLGIRRHVYRGGHQLIASDQVYGGLPAA